VTSTKLRGKAPGSLGVLNGQFGACDRIPISLPRQQAAAAKGLKQLGNGVERARLQYTQEFNLRSKILASGFDWWGRNTGRAFR
jgi:hypothetical protein